MTADEQAFLNALAQLIESGQTVVEGSAETVGNPGDYIMVKVGNKSRRVRCATVVNSRRVLAVFDGGGNGYVWSESAPEVKTILRRDFLRKKPRVEEQPPTGAGILFIADSNCFDEKGSPESATLIPFTDQDYADRKKFVFNIAKYFGLDRPNAVVYTVGFTAEFPYKGDDQAITSSSILYAKYFFKPLIEAYNIEVRMVPEIKNLSGVAHPVVIPTGDFSKGYGSLTREEAQIIKKLGQTVGVLIFLEHSGGSETCSAAWGSSAKNILKALGVPIKLNPVGTVNDVQTFYIPWIPVTTVDEEVKTLTQGITRVRPNWFLGTVIPNDYTEICTPVLQVNGHVYERDENTRWPPENLSPMFLIKRNNIVKLKGFS